MYPYPICGDPSKMYTTYYCSSHSACTSKGGFGRHRRVVDYAGDVCDPGSLVSCPC